MRPGPRSYCNPWSGSILPYSAVCVSCPKVSFRSVLWNVLLATNWYERAVSTGSTVVGPFKAVPSLGSSVKNDLPKLNAISGMYHDSSGTMVMVAFGEFTPTHLLQELAGVI